jgi:hypothetical protein
VEKRRGGIPTIFLFVQSGRKFMGRMCQSDMVLRNPLLIADDLFASFQILFAQPHELIGFFCLKIEPQHKIGEKGHKKEGQGKRKYSRLAQKGKKREERDDLNAADHQKDEMEDDKSADLPIERVQSWGPELCDLFVGLVFVKNGTGGRAHRKEGLMMRMKSIDIPGAIKWANKIDKPSLM